MEINKLIKRGGPHPCWTMCEKTLVNVFFLIKLISKQKQGMRNNIHTSYRDACVCMGVPVCVFVFCVCVCVCVCVSVCVGTLESAFLLKLPSLIVHAPI